MENMQKRSEREQIGSSETKVECPRCHAIMIAKLVDIKSNKLLRCRICRTPINDLEMYRQDEYENLHH